MYYPNIREEELKNKVAQEWFSKFDCTKIVGNIDFCVMPKQPIKQTQLFETQPLLWAETKTGSKDITQMFAQLILTIGKAKTFASNNPPYYLSVFDGEKIAFVEYAKIQHLFHLNDFNWNVTPSNTNTKEFVQIANLISQTLASFNYTYYFAKDDFELKNFIDHNLAKAQSNKIQIDHNNFVAIYLRWLDEIKPLIDVDFELIKQSFNILDNDFYLADLFIDDNDSDDLTSHMMARENLFVTFAVVERRGKLEGNYEIIKENLNQSLFSDTTSDRTYKLTDITKYTNFWYRYKRPPAKEYQDFIIKRRDLLVPQDVRERKGAFFTPKKWVELSQQYLAKTLGDNWQDEYVVWDCAAGTGNLLAGLTNKRNVRANTLDSADVSVMREWIENGANLYASHVFQFDFLNDELFDEYEFSHKKPKGFTSNTILDDGKYKVDIIDTETGFANVTIENGGKSASYELKLKQRSKVPNALQDILRDPLKRKKLLIYINPPYAEVGSKPGEIGKIGVEQSKTHDKYQNILKVAGKELFAQFLMRIYQEIPHCSLANFSTLKNLQGSNFLQFRKVFTPKLESLFLMPADTFDNVKGQFPIGFFVWNGLKKAEFQQITADVYDANVNELPNKLIVSLDFEIINKWIVKYRSNLSNTVGFLVTRGNDFQNKSYIFIANSNKKFGDPRGIWINCRNLIPSVIYLAVRQAISATWLNDRDQFLYPNNSWESDITFHNDCLAFTLFSGQNRISYKEGINHFIPFTEEQLGIKQDNFASNFMTDFLAGKNPVVPQINTDLANTTDSDLINISDLTAINPTVVDLNSLRQLAKSELIILITTSLRLLSLVSNSLNVKNINELNTNLATFTKAKLIKLITANLNIETCLEEQVQTELFAEELPIWQKPCI